jgi:WD40 repeat protein
MLKELIFTNISTQEITLEPGGNPVSFDVMVVNNSDQFATFQVELLAAGAKTGKSANWYRVTPEVCTKKPPGDSTQFCITVLDSPKAGFTGLMTMTVRVFSLELPSSDSRLVVRLIIPGTGAAAPQLDLPNEEFKGYPGEKFQIAVSLESYSPRATKVTLRLLGLDSSWFPEGTEKRLLLPVGEKIKEVFECQIPSTAEALSDRYAFTIEANQLEAPLVHVQGYLTVLPEGFINFECIPLRQKIPEKLSVWRDRNADTAEYTLQFDNQSNLRQEASVEVSYVEEEKKTLNLIFGIVDSIKSKIRLLSQSENGNEPIPNSKSQISSLEFEVMPEKADLKEGGLTHFSLKVKQKRPWLGRTKRKFLQAKAVTNDKRIEIQNDTQTLELQVLPVIPEWLQLGGLCIGVLLSLVLSNRLLWLGQQHTDTVNTVRLNGLAEEMVSGSNDQTIRRWRVESNGLALLGVLPRANKAVRVLRYRPVNNDKLAVGFENGQIQLFNLLSGKAEPPFTAKIDDRVFDLMFTKDSRSLFSGHGSGLVVQWTLDGLSSRIFRKQQVGFAVNALALVGEAESHLAIAGRFNQLTLWDLKANQLRSVSTGSNTNKDYIFTLASSDSKPNLLVTGDNQGTIKIWNLRPCLRSKAKCELVDEWTADSQAVRAVAMSSDGCYLASAGESGQAKLWSLNEDGERNSKNLTGKVLIHSAKSLTSVDIIRIRDEILVVSGSEEHLVKQQRVKQFLSDCR